MKRFCFVLIACMLLICSSWAKAELFIDFESPIYTPGNIAGQEGWIGGGSPNDTPDIVTTNTLMGGQILRTYAGEYAYKSIAGHFSDITTVEFIVKVHTAADYGAFKISDGGSNRIFDITLDGRGTVKDITQGASAVTTGDFFLKDTAYKVTAVINFTAQTVTFRAVNMHTDVASNSVTLAFLNTLTLAQANTSGRMTVSGATSSVFWDNISIYSGEPQAADSFASEYQPDANTVALYHFDEAYKRIDDDAANAVKIENAQGDHRMDLTTYAVAGSNTSMEVGAPGAIYGAVGNMSRLLYPELLIDFEAPTYDNGGSIKPVHDQDGWTGSNPAGDPRVGTFNQIVGGDVNELRTATGTYGYKSISSQMFNITTIKTEVSTYDNTTLGELRIAVGGFLGANAICDLVLDSRTGVLDVYPNGKTHTVDYVTTGDKFVSQTDYEITVVLDFTTQQYTASVVRLSDMALMGSATFGFMNSSGVSNPKTLAEAQASTYILLYSSGSSTFWDNISVWSSSLSDTAALGALYQANYPSLLNLSEWTAEFWWKPVSFSPQAQYLLCRDGGTGKQAWNIVGANLGTANDRIMVNFWDDLGEPYTVSTPAGFGFNLHQWYHIAVTYKETTPSDATVQIYITPQGDTTANLITESALGGQMAKPTHDDSRLTVLHNFYRELGRFVPGKIDELRISNKVRTAGEFTTLLPPSEPEYRTVGSLSAQTRRIVEQVWDNRKQYLNDYIDYDLGTNHSTTCLYNIQAYTTNLLRYASFAKDYDMIDELCRLYLRAHTYYSTDRWKNGLYENKINSTQFIYVLSVAVNAVLDVPSGSRTTNMNSLLTTYVPVILTDHLNRWINTAEWYSTCGSGPYTHLQHLTNLKIKSYSASPSYCNAVEDRDMWVIASVAEMLAANHKNSALVPMAPSFKSGLLTYMNIASELLQSRMTESQLTNFDRISPVVGLNFDAGAWTDWVDNDYAGYTGENYPTIPNDKSPVEGIGWDISHASRFPYVFNSLYSAKTATGQTFPTDAILVGLSNQFAFGAFNKAMQRPQFNNYMDGTNGWYRVGYSGPGSGYAPSGLSYTVFYGPYGSWSAYNPSITTVMNLLWKMLNSVQYVKNGASGGYDAINNGAQWRSGGPRSGYLEFDGYLNNNPQAPSVSTVDTGLWASSQGSIEFWVKTSSASGQTFVEIKKTDSDYLAVSTVTIGATAGIRLVRATGGSIVIDVRTATGLDLDSWYHVVVTQDGSAVKIYINGSQATLTGTNGTGWTSHLAGTDAAGYPTSGTLRIGDGIYGPFYGGLDEVRVYNRALSSAEVSQHYAGTFSNNTGLVLYLSMNEDISKDGAAKLAAEHLNRDYIRSSLWHKQYALPMLQFLPALAQVIELGPTEANLDGLGRVNLVDFAMLAKDFNKAGMSLWGDIDGDDDVDIADLKELATYWLSE